MDELKIAKNTFTKHLNELKDRGYIKVTQNRIGEGKMYNNIYEIVFDKKTIEKMWITSPCLKICDSNSNNININSKYVYEQENKTVDNPITEFKKLYEQNIGVVYPIKAQWLTELSQEIDIHLFKRAIEICAENEKMSNSYLNGILRKWRDKNITTYEQLKTYELGVRNKQESTEKKTTKESYKPKKTKFHNFNETFQKYSPEEMDEIIRKSQREKFK
jgi:DnaD/phage-associated family protein